jgi:hypothetical protein
MDAKYTVWFSPERDGCVMKMIRVQEADGPRRQEGSQSQLPEAHSDAPVRKVRVTQTLEAVETRRIGRSWIPVRGTYTEIIDYPQGPPSLVIKTVLRTRVELDPDVRDISFTPNIPNGTEVRLTGARAGIPWEWQDGKIVPREDKEATARLNSLVSNRRFEPPPKPGFRFGVFVGPVAFLCVVAAGTGLTWLWSSARSQGPPEVK